MFDLMRRLGAVAVLVSVADASGPLSCGPPNVNVSGGAAGNEAEAAIAINPTDPSNVIIAGYAPTFGPIHAHWSTDGGDTWSLTAIGQPDDGLACQRGDPYVAFDDNGIAYVTYIAFNCADGSHSILVARSDDGGQSYPQVTPMVVDPTGRADKEILCAGPDPVNPNQQNVYVAYTFPMGGDAELHVATSYDGGLTFPVDVVVNDDSLATFDQTLFGTPSVGPAGEVYVVWDDFSAAPNFSRIMIDVSFDGGVTWGTDVQVGTSRVTWSNPNGFTPPANIKYHIAAQPERGILSVPSIAVDRTGGVHDGRVHVAYTVLGSGGIFDTDVVTRYSDTQGATWSAATVVHDDGGTGSQFLPWLDVDRCAGGVGEVCVGFYDTRADPADEKVEVFLATSDDGGATFGRNIKVSTGQSDQSLDNPGSWIGNYLEYIGVSVCDRRACVVWSDNSADPSNLDFVSDCICLDPACPGDTDASGAVDIDDIVNVVLDFGTTGTANGGDVNMDGTVDIDDIVLVVLNFGRCP